MGSKTAKLGSLLINALQHFFYFLKVADRLSKEPKISVIYTSDLKRALETAETIAARCGGVEVFIHSNYQI